MSDLSDSNPPYHLVQAPEHGGKHMGPFSTYLDAALASQIAVVGWRYGTMFDRATIMNKKEFDKHLKRKST